VPIVLMGNTDAVHVDAGGNTVSLPGNLITKAMVLAVDDPVDQQAMTITAEVATGATMDGAWRSNSRAPAPAWVESDSPDLAQALASHYGCPIGRPDDWETP
jgi:hypothetical protein